MSDTAHSATLLSPTLHPGDRVRLVSPASFPDRAWVAESVAILEGWGLAVEVADHALDRHGYMAGTDSDRLSDLNDAFRDPGVRAIIATRGGAGAYRIADDIDFDAVRADPKPLVGFSDITSLHLALWRHCRLASIHGCLAGAEATASVRQLLMSTEPLTIGSDPQAMSAGVRVAGRATGPLIGGNLTAVAGSVGVRLPRLDGAILFLETPRGIGLGLVDRQDRVAGTLDRAGVSGGPSRLRLATDKPMGPPPAPMRTSLGQPGTKKTPIAISKMPTTRKARRRSSSGRSATDERCPPAPAENRICITRPDRGRRLHQSESVVSIVRWRLGGRGGRDQSAGSVVLIRDSRSVTESASDPAASRNRPRCWVRISGGSTT